MNIYIYIYIHNLTQRLKCRGRVVLGSPPFALAAMGRSAGRAQWMAHQQHARSRSRPGVMTRGSTTQGKSSSDQNAHTRRSTTCIVNKTCTTTRGREGGKQSLGVHNATPRDPTRERPQGKAPLARTFTRQRPAQGFAHTRQRKNIASPWRQSHSLPENGLPAQHKMLG